MLIHSLEPSVRGWISPSEPHHSVLRIWIENTCVYEIYKFREQSNRLTLMRGCRLSLDRSSEREEGNENQNGGNGAPPTEGLQFCPSDASYAEDAADADGAPQS